VKGGIASKDEAAEPINKEFRLEFRVLSSYLMHRTKLKVLFHSEEHIKGSLEKHIMSKFNSNEILLLMVNLIQFQDKERILKIFINTVKNIDSGVEIKYSKKLSDKYKFTVPISTLKSNFGVLNISGDYDNEFLDMIQNAVAMLALILEKIEQDEILEKASDEKYKSVIQDLPILICRNSKEGIIEFVNEPYCEYFGKSREELVGRDFYNLIPKEEKEMVQSNLAKLNSENPMLVHEYKVIDAKGEIKFHRWTNRAICDTKGKLITIQSYGEDITKQKEAEDKLIESQRRLTTLITNISGMVYRCKNNKNWTMEFISPGAQNLTGYTPEEFINGKIHFSDIIHPDDSERVWNEVQKSLKNNTLFEFDYRIITKDGKEKWVFERGSKVQDETTKSFWLEGFIADITDKKTTEEERELGERLRAIGQLAGGVAHDLNNNLTAVMGFTSLLELELENEEHKHYLETINTATKRSAELTTQLLAFARKGKYENRHLDIHSIINDIISLLSRSISKKIKLVSELKANTSTTLGDSGQLSNAILNIAINARDAIENKSGTIKFSTKIACKKMINKIKDKHNLNQDDYLQIDISDTGKGMDEEIIKHIFEPFFTTKGEGNGLGLAAAYGTVLNHKGVITASSKIGKGTTITIYLPLNHKKRAKKKGTSELEKGVGNVMIVDDEEYILEVTNKMLKRLGYKAHPYQNVKKAISFYKKSYKKIDLIIIDLLMPELDGEEAFVEFRKINPSAKILVSSGYSRAKSIKNLKAMGAVGSLPKPYKLDTFSKAVKKALKK